MNPNLVLPVGTRIVTRVEVKTDAARALRPVGAVAEIVAIPADALHSYRVRFPDGAEASVRRREFSIWSQYREEAAGGPDPLIDHELFAHVIYRCVIGSRAYGLDGPASDTRSSPIRPTTATSSGSSRSSNRISASGGRSAGST